MCIEGHSVRTLLLCAGCENAAGGALRSVERQGCGQLGVLDKQASGQRASPVLAMPGCATSAMMAAIAMEQMMCSSRNHGYVGHIYIISADMK